MSTSGRKRKQQLKPRQDVHRSPVKRASLDIKSEHLDSSYPLADYDCVDIKPDLTELQLQLAATNEKDAAITTTATEQCRTELQLEQQSDSEEDGYSEVNYEAKDVFCTADQDDYDPEWNIQQTFPRSLFKFDSPTQQTGLKKFVCPQYYFNQLLGNRSEFFAQLAKGCNARCPKLSTSAAELEIFVGLCLLMSDIKLQHLSDYWSQQVFYGFAGFHKKMSNQRFMELLEQINFDELQPNSEVVTSDAGKLINYFNGRMSQLYVCGQQLVLNEPILQWKGKFCFQHELVPKQRSHALMLHLLSEQKGLIIRILPELLEQQQPARNSRQLVTQRNELVLKMLEQHKQHGHTVYVCKYYGSYGLAYELEKRGTYCSGLLDRNRYGNSKTLVHQSLVPNCIANRYAEPLMMAKWRRRNKSVYFFSSDCVAIYSKELSMQKINQRPKLVQELDFHLRRVQPSRQHLINYQPSCQGMLPQQQLIIYLLNLLIYNAHLLYCANAQSVRGSRRPYSEFRSAIIKSLLREDATAAAPTTSAPVTADTPVVAAINPQEARKSKRPSSCTQAQKISSQGKHELVAIQQHGKPARKNCRHCHKSGMLQFTKYMCKLCPDMPGLCEEPCFQLWHDQLKN
ncbi:uncharacterized protein LOC108603768 [Drosophila busckii]|uniref:uncharacterized protein LOC108603768 n=1 Tax=Drosophila busckii TaxID=30019 RepID=UPI00083EFF22|nr:uncharacterized protein LOC108603768 [Drosophila busckii]